MIERDNYLFVLETNTRFCADRFSNTVKELLIQESQSLPDEISAS